MLLKALLVLHCQEPPRSHSLQRLLQELTSWAITLGVAPELLELDDFAVLARYDKPLQTSRLPLNCTLAMELKLRPLLPLPMPPS